MKEYKGQAAKLFKLHEAKLVMLNRKQDINLRGSKGKMYWIDGPFFFLIPLVKPVKLKK